ncbi:MAG: hypothetical protein ABIP79_06250 [Chitinophagaceae bacterium]
MKNLLFITFFLLISIVTVAKKDKLIENGSTTPLAGNMYFSNQPFTGSSANSKKSFNSAEYIYGRLELPSGTIKESFKLSDENKGLPYLQMSVTISKAGGDNYVMQFSNYYALLSDQYKNSNTFNFDILPEGSKATTVYSLLDDFSAGLGHFPLSSGIGYANLSDGNYKVSIKIYMETKNTYGYDQTEDKWPTLEGEFDFTFKEDDYARIKSNSNEGSDLALENAFRYDKLPPVFSNPGKLTDPGATSAKIAAILKRDLPQRQIIKWVAETYSGSYWSIAKDDYGLPKYKYFNPHIWMAYKMDGKCYVGYVTLRQVYSGGGTYGPLGVAWTSTKDDKGIGCDKVK